MSMRDWMNENSTVVTIGAVALLVVALVVLVTQTGGGPRGSGNAWFYDIETQEIFRASGDQRPPITSPDGNEAVRAYRFTCGRCIEAEMFVGYYEKYPEGAVAREEVQPTGPEDAARIVQQQYMEGIAGVLHSTDAENWFTSTGPQGAQLRQQIDDRCEDGPAQLCEP